MTTIHVDTGLLRQLGSLFCQLNGQIHDQIKPQLRGVTHQLEAGWQGPTRIEYDQMFSDWIIKLDTVTQAGNQLGQHLQNIATHLEQADQGL